MYIAIMLFQVQSSSSEEWVSVKHSAVFLILQVCVVLHEICGHASELQS